jgi:hypothetical protein
VRFSPNGQYVVLGNREGLQLYVLELVEDEYKVREVYKNI